MLLITIITICKNSEKTIEKTIKSVICQKAAEYEYLIIDGNSEDGTQDLIKKYEGNLCFISEDDRGISDAFNKGIERASGKYLIFLNSGDLFIGENILSLVSEKLMNSEADIFTFNEITSKGDIWIKSKSDAEKQWRDSLIPHQSTFIKKEVFNRIGTFNENFKIRMDYDFFKRCYRAGCSFDYHLDSIVKYDLNGISARNIVDYEKEGLSIRLLYDKEISFHDINVLSQIAEDYNYSCFSGGCVTEIKKRQKSELYQEYLEKYINKLQSGQKISDILKRDNFNNVAIYGWGGLGRILYNELEITGINTAMVIDINAKNAFVKIYGLNDEWTDVDAVCITVMGDVGEIKDLLKKRGKYRIFSLCDFLDE